MSIIINSPGNRVMILKDFRISNGNNLFLSKKNKKSPYLSHWRYFFVISSNLTFGKSEINYDSSSNERPKKLLYDFKVGLARLWHGALQREREITLHTWSTKKPFEMDCWVGSSLAQVVALMAQPLGAGILGLDKTLAGPVSVGTGPSSGSS